MANQKIKRIEKSKISDKMSDKWKLHDIYAESSCCSRVVTRAQVAFIKIKNTESDLKLFADNRKHQPPGMLPLMNTLKGEYGAVPRTIITRKVAQYVPVSETLYTEINKYKTIEVTDVVTNEKIKGYNAGKKETVVNLHKGNGGKQEMKTQAKKIKEKQDIVPIQFKKDIDTQKTLATGYRQSSFLGEYNNNLLVTVNNLILKAVLIVNELPRKLIYNRLPYFGTLTKNKKIEDTNDTK